MHSIYRSSEKVTICLELPGVQPGDLDVSVRDGELSIRSASLPCADGRRILSELSGGETTRRYRLDPGLDPGGIEAVLRDGLLILSVPRRNNRRQITVSAA